jgi:glycine/D-amino acid oxidase-like deaminating enzyme/nitrite reductase/ring-hydroxylating ferredoxin subunit
MIQRDGACESLWQASAEEYITKNSAVEKFYDVAIAGGGITGITTALLLQKAGKKCIVFEAYNLCFGTTGGTTAHLNTLLDNPYTTISKNFGEDNAKLVADASKEAIELVKNHIQEYKIDCEFEDASAYLFAQTDDQVKELKSIHDACRDVKLKVVYADSLPLNIHCKKAMIVDGQAKFHPVKYVHALAKAFEDAGGVIVQQCRVEDVENNQTVKIKTSKGDYESQYFIYATHIPMGINLLHLRCAPYRSYAMAVSLQDEKYPGDLFYDMYDPYHYIRSQKIGDKTYLIVGAEDHKTGHIENTNECFDKLEAYTKRHFNISNIDYKWSSQYFEPADTLPYIGHLPGQENNILVATGYGGNGMTYSHIAAVTLRSILLNEDDPKIKLFNPNRIKPVAGFVSFLSHNADVAKEFASKLLGYEKLEKSADLKSGNGKVVKYEGETVALHKDENGSLHAVNPVCKHMKCSVAWNEAEQTWDCPCHGARYAVNGIVVTGPANRDLEKIEVQKN